jgi:hypothetical protein
MLLTCVVFMRAFYHCKEVELTSTKCSRKLNIPLQTRSDDNVGATDWYSDPVQLVMDEHVVAELTCWNDKQELQTRFEVVLDATD